MSRLAIARAGKSHNHEHFGNYEIVSSATVAKSGVPGRYEVVLASRRDLAAIARITSAVDGTYQFRYLNPDTVEGFVLIAFDHGGAASPAISDTPVLTPMAFDF